MVKIGIVGASGYTGAELVRLLSNHPQVKIAAATSETFSGQTLGQIYPGLGRAGQLPLVSLAQAKLAPETVDVVFLALPHGESHAQAPGFLASGIKVIDLSGDFRFHDPAVYETWYKHPHAAKAFADKAVYGLPELFREKIKGAQFVSNPGCFVTSVALGAYPLLRAKLVAPGDLIVDSKTGLTGSGRKPKPDNMFTTVSENVVPYKLAGVHQHTPEMEMALSQATGQEVVLTFTPQLVSARRGILSMIYGKLTKKTSSAELTALFAETYKSEPFVRVNPAGAPWPDLASAVGSNDCVLAAAVDERTGTAVVVSVLDNLVKGASGQAVQNMNLICGLEETLGLPKAGFVL
jgi:N-acetyl-gamma-glutamyl-phosphate reductase